MIRELIDENIIRTISALVVEDRTLDGRLISSRPPTEEEVSAANTGGDLAPLLLPQAQPQEPA